MVFAAYSSVWPSWNWTLSTLVSSKGLVFDVPTGFPFSSCFQPVTVARTKISPLGSSTSAAIKLSYSSGV
jgi:hypothetical protein